jgi:FlaG/FlaF family flagellin (archaellin)
MKRISDSKKYNYSKSKQNDLKPSIKGVSEAIGTILLLSISVSLVGVLAYWVHSLPSPEEFIEADLGAKIMLENNQYILLIEHTGGEAFDVDKIEVLIEINGVSVWKNELFYSAQTIFDNGLWEIGEVWTKNINTFHNWNLSLPEVAVDVKDISSNSLILTGKVDYDVSFGILPDLKVGEEDITFEFLNSTLRNSEWVNISARIHNLFLMDRK